MQVLEIDTLNFNTVSYSSQNEQIISLNISLYLWFETFYQSE